MLAARAVAERSLTAPFQVSTRLAPALPRTGSGLPGNPRIALVCDASARTNEGTNDCVSTLDALHRLYPRATVYPHAAAHLDLRAHTLIISMGDDAGANWMQSARINPLATHVRICQSPSRPSAPRERERLAAREIDYLIAGSLAAQEHLARDYGRLSAIIHPPLALDAVEPGADLDDYFLLVSPLVPEACVDVAVRAFTRLGLPLVIVGDGPQRRQLRRLAGPSVRLVGRVPDAELSERYARCRALIYTGCEDLPVAPLRAQAAGRPVLALAASGARETVVAGTTGAFFDSSDADALASAVRAFDPSAYRSTVIQRHARTFGEARFAAQFHAYLVARLGAPAAPLVPARVIHLAPLPPAPAAFPFSAPGRETGRAGSIYAITKRALDIAGSCAGLVLLAPVFASIALLVKAEDHGPVLHHREIVGQGGQHFYALKFRTMIPDADGYLLSHPNLLREYQANIKLRRDPRITRIGAVLRRTSLDELPQLVNVLRGQMSLVGPRMIHPSEEARYGDFAARRRSMRPGITGLWQVSGRQDVSYERRIVLDQQYLRERSTWLDLTILLRTFAVVFRRQGAY